MACNAGMASVLARCAAVALALVAGGRVMPVTAAPVPLEIHVDQTAAAAGDGSQARPLTSIEAAQAMIRERHRDSASRAAAITVHIAPGVYRLQRSLRFSTDDSGTPAGPVRYVGAGAQRTILSGAVALGRVATAEAVTAGDALAGLPQAASLRKLPLAGAGAGEGVRRGIDLSRNPHSKDEKTGPPELFVGGVAMQLARWPNEGWARVRAVPAGGAKSGRFVADIPQAARWIGHAHWVRGYFHWDWYDETLPATLTAQAQTRIDLARPTVYGIKEKSRFVVLNEPSEMDTEGEYFADYDAGWVYFLPRAADAAAEVEMSVAEWPLLRFEGASHITLHGLGIEAGRAHGIVVRGGESLVFEACRVANMGNAGIVITGGSGHRVEDSTITDIGTTGLAISGGNRARLIGSGHVVRGNVVQRVGRRVSSGHPGIEIGGVGVRVAENRLQELPHAGIIFPGNDHVIEANELVAICGEASDCGAIYLGRDWTSQGSTVRNNYVHDAPGAYPKASVMGVYLDDLASGVSVFGNVVENVHRGVLVGGGRDNAVVNNLFHRVTEPVSMDARGSHWAARFVVPGGALPAKLKQMPYRRPPWSERYPRLVDILDDEPALPKRNRIENNLLSASGPMALNPVAAMLGTVAGNVEQDTADATEPGAALRLAGASGRIREAIPGWVEIPLPVGADR